MKNTKKKYNIVFWGTPSLCTPYLEKIHKDEKYKIVAIVTNPDKPVGRKQTINPSPVKTWGLKKNIPILQPEKLNNVFLEQLSLYNIDISIVVAYGKIIPETIINLPTHKTLNVHYSLLPRWRGASPVESAILAGDIETGVSIQKMVFELDAGDIIAEKKINLEGTEFTETLKEKLSEYGSELVIETLPKYLNQEIEIKPQETHNITKCRIIRKSDGEIQLYENSIGLWRKYRAYKPWPGIFYFDSSGKRIKITDAQFKNGEFIIKKIIPEGKKEISWEEYQK